MTVSIEVTDRALVRWLERSGAVPVEQLRAMLSTSLARAAQAAARVEAEHYSIIADGLIYCVHHGKVVTVLNDHGLHDRVSAMRSRDR